MTNTLVGKKVTLNGKDGIVTYQRHDGALMVDFDGKQIACLAHSLGLPEINSHEQKWVVDIAYQYGIDTAEVKRQNMAFLQAEGYYETARGTVECPTFEQWIKLASAKEQYKITEPWQKSDLGYGL